MNVYEITSRWSKELVVAKNISEAIRKYKRSIPRNIAPVESEIQMIHNMGESI